MESAPPSLYDITPHDLMLMGVMPTPIAALGHVALTDGPWRHLLLDHLGFRGTLIVHGQTVVHAELRSPLVRSPGGLAGHLVYKGKAALLATAILCNGPVEIELTAAATPLTGHAPNLDPGIDLTRALLQMAVAADEAMPISEVPCVFEPVDPGPPIDLMTLAAVADHDSPQDTLRSESLRLWSSPRL